MRNQADLHTPPISIEDFLGGTVENIPGLEWGRAGLPAPCSFFLNLPITEITPLSHLHDQGLQGGEELG